MKTLRPGLRVADDGTVIVDISALLKGYGSPDTMDNRMRLLQVLSGIAGGGGVKLVTEGHPDFVPAEVKT